MNYYAQLWLIIQETALEIYRKSHGKILKMGLAG